MPGPADAAPPAADDPIWQALPVADAIAALQTSVWGLPSTEAAGRLAKHGRNRLPAGKPRDLLHRLFAQIGNLLIYVLLAAAAIAAMLGHGIDAARIELSIRPDQGTSD